jgi:perosamine synthetase
MYRREDRISVAKPNLAGNELRYVKECLESTWISSQGKFIDAFEREFASFCGVKHAISCNNGTTALHLALVGLGVRSGDEIIVPDLTYIASANCVRYCGAEPIFVDCNDRSFNIDPNQIESRITPRTKGIIAVHLYGQSCDFDPIQEIADRHGLFVIEDAAEAHGACYKGRRVGALGRCASFSFFGNKIITTGEGGAVVTNDTALASHLRLLRGQGMDPSRRYWFPIVGFNYRMTNLAAAIGLAQLERIEEALAFRKRLASWYDELLSGDLRIICPHTEVWAEHSYWMYTVMLGADVRVSRDKVIERMDLMGIETRPVFYPMHVLPPYAQSAAAFPRATSCAERGLNLPTHEHLTKGNVARICSALYEAVC